jgi:hypothetical protein
LIALLVVESALIVSMMQFRHFYRMGGNTCFFGVENGNAIFEQHPGDLTISNSDPRFAFRWTPPDFGDWTQFHRVTNSDSFGFVIPLWIILALAVLWITFREWQRKRAAKGKPCPL